MDKELISAKLDKLPEDLKKEVLHYMEFLLHKYQSRRETGDLKFDWENGLSELKNDYTSVELQHKASEWR